jgi:phosphohistidine phosphatase
MQQLLILRHAKAVPWTPTAEDFPRPLQPAGTGHAQRVAGWIHAHLDPPEAILCSPSQRARETLAPLLRLNPRLETVTHFTPQLYQASAATLTGLLDGVFTEANRVLLVGHNPSLERLVADVIHRRHHDAFRRLPTGTLAVVEFTPDWFESRDSGRLSHFVRGKHLSVD